jgi:hypothetical protein
MKSLEGFAKCGDAGGGGDLNLKALVVYEDLETGLRARQSLERTLQRLEASLDIQIDLWRFDLFDRPAFLKHATEQNADIVVFSTHGQAQLPATVDLWLREWFVRQGDEPRALAVLLDDQAMDLPGASKMVEVLSAAARRAGVDVFLPAAPERQWEPAIHNIHHRANTRTLLLDEVLHRLDRPPSRDWGINE